MVVKASVVIPVYNEEGYLLPMSEAIGSDLNEIIGKGQWEFVLVDNGSVDGTHQEIERIQEKYKTRSIFLDKPDFGEAIFQGLMAAKGEWAFIINVDWWDVPFLKWSWQTKGLYDIVLGSKRADSTLNQQSRYRRTLSWGLNSLLQAAFGFVGTDTHGLKFVRLSSIKPILEKCVMRRGQLDTEMVLRSMRSGLWIAEIPVPIVEVRPPRNFMISKIGRNVVDIIRLKMVLRRTPVTQPIRYHRWAREDILIPSGPQAEFLLNAVKTTHTED